MLKVQKKTKIVCTLGPSSASHEVIRGLFLAGMNVARLNFSHGDHTEKTVKFNIVRSLAKEFNTPIGIIADMSGPKLRLGDLDGIINIHKGQEVTLALNPIEDELPIQFDLAPFVRKNQRILLNDGLVELKVTSVLNKTIKTKAQNSGWISSHKGVNVPDTYVKGGAFTDKDLTDSEFALNMGADYIALSFVQAAQDLKPLRSLIKKYQAQTKIIVKLEKLEAVKNLEEIIQATDAIMVARGDLGSEAPVSEVPLIQQQIIRLSRQYQKPVIVATQMLESMIENPRPTRAEASDVANAVFDQVDAVMLSAESATGKYPIDAVKIMSEIIQSVENRLEYKHYFKIDWQNVAKNDLTFNAIASSAASLAYRIDASVIALTTTSGRMARLVASFRPDTPILAIAPTTEVANQLTLVWGVESVVAKTAKLIELINQKGYNQKGNRLVTLSCPKIGQSGSTDTLKVITL